MKKRKQNKKNLPQPQGLGQNGANDSVYEQDNELTTIW